MSVFQFIYYYVLSGFCQFKCQLLKKSIQATIGTEMQQKTTF